MKIRQKCWFNPKPEGKKKNLAHVVSLLVVPRNRCGGGKIKKTSQERRVGCAQKYQRVSPERSGGHQFCYTYFYGFLSIISLTTHLSVVMRRRADDLETHIFTHLSVVMFGYA